MTELTLQRRDGEENTKYLSRLSLFTTDFKAYITAETIERTIAYQAKSQKNRDEAEAKRALLNTPQGYLQAEKDLAEVKAANAERFAENTQRAAELKEQQALRSAELKEQKTAELKATIKAEMDSMKAELKAELKAEMDAEMSSMRAEILSLKATITTLTEHSDIELDAILDSAMFEIETIDETVGSILLKDIQ